MLFRSILAAAGIGLIVAWETWIYMQRNPISPDLQAAHIVDTLRSHPLDGQRLLTPQNYVPLLHYYFPLVRLSSYHDEAERLKAIKGGGIDAVLNGSEVVRIPVP